jgi:GNAT superfamily N-acetyltransferase
MNDAERAAVPSGFALSDEPPTLAEYVALRPAAGLSPITEEQGAPALTASWAWVTVREEATGELVAMGRVLGDGGWYFHVADMATRPDRQRRGLGGAVLARLLERIRTEAPLNPYVTLMADEPGRPLYRAFGFVETAPESLGMMLPREPAACNSDGAAQADARGQEPA